MRISVYTFGAPKLDYAKSGVGMYAKRLTAAADLKLTHLKEGERSVQTLLQAAEGRYLVILDDGGRQFASEELAGWLAGLAREGVKEALFVVGGADGFDRRVVERADLKWSLGRQTMPHDLAQLVLLEALYRADTINRGHPYHRA